VAVTAEVPDLVEVIEIDEEAAAAEAVLAEAATPAAG